ncbi:MAG: methionyl-tRNA formyltransferase [Coriobacteriia bacterium]|nr:methionyl-tRNA formyltransferase [Coriobacteriia bacterium]
MRVVFMGTPAFAVPSLKALDAAGHTLLAVYTRPDSVSGRGSARRPCGVKVAADELGIPVHQPRTLRSTDEHEILRELAPDLIVVVAYGLILPANILEIPTLGTLNVHASLLPRWRGAAPIQRAILAGDSAVGVSIMRVEEGLDTGAYCAQAGIPSDDLTARDLTEKLAVMGAGLLVSTLPAIEGGSAEWTRQDEALVTYAEKVTKGDVLVGPEMSADEALRRIRASLPTAPSRVQVAGYVLTLLDAHVGSDHIPSGSVVCKDEALLLGFADGVLEVTRVKPESRSEMDVCAWARGARDLANAVWGVVL